MVGHNLLTESANTLISQWSCIDSGENYMQLLVQVEDLIFEHLQRKFPQDEASVFPKTADQSAREEQEKGVCFCPRFPSLFLHLI